MSTKENALGARVRLNLSRLGVTLWRNSIGYDRQRKIPYGLGGKGASDFLGYTRVQITPEMVGCTVAVFTAIETKGSDRTPVTKEQQRFVDAVKSSGGIAGIVRTEEDATRIIEESAHRAGRGGDDGVRKA